MANRGAIRATVKRSWPITAGGFRAELRIDSTHLTVLIRTTRQLTEGENVLVEGRGEAWNLVERAPA